MGRAVFCDRCGQYGKMSDSREWKYLESNTPNSSDPVGERPGILLCPNCRIGFEHWMESGK